VRKVTAARGPRVTGGGHGNTRENMFEPCLTGYRGSAHYPCTPGEKEGPMPFHGG
jgi:hypothetical protein